MTARSTRALLVALALGCAVQATAGGRRDEPAIVDDAMQYALRDREKAARLLEDAITNDTHLSGADRDWLRVHAGEQRRLNGETGAAVDHFRAASASKDDPDAATAGALGVALVDAIAGIDEAGFAALKSAPDGDVLPTQNAERYALLAEHAANSGDAQKTREYTKKALAYAKKDPLVLQDVRRRLEALAKGGGPDVAVAVADNSPPLVRAEAAFDAGRTNDARRHLDQALAIVQPDSDDALAAAYLDRKLDSGWTPDPQTIGLLLPTSGKYEAAAGQIREAFELGYRESGARRRLVIEDAGETPESAVAAAEKLVFEHRASAIVGPLRTEGAADVARAVDAMRVPMVALSQAPGIAGGREWVLQGMPTPEDQVRALLDVAMGKSGMKAFAIFAPESPYGHAAADAFRAEVERRGGTITVQGFYDPASNDVIPAAKELGRKDYQGRAAELTKLRKETKEKGGDPSRVVLPPTLDFDALFLPDNASRIPIACAGLAYEEFPIGDFKPTKTSRTIPLLGLSGWNNEALVTLGGIYVRNSLFTDAWYPDDADAVAFSERFAQTLGRPPTPLEATAYDLGRLVGSGAASDADTPVELLDAVSRARLDRAVTGTSAFDRATRSASHRIRVLSIGPKSIVPVDTAPEATPPP